MKNIITYLFLLIAINAYSANYYLATDGNNGNPGTLAEPWLTWQYSLDQLRAGDTLFVRGGVYETTARLNIAGTYDGTALNPIVVMAYQTDYEASNFPTIDCIGYKGDGIWIRDTEYWSFKGITIRNALQQTVVGGANEVTGVTVSRSNMVNFENCTMHHIGGYGIKYDQTLSGAVYYVTNCDAYNNVDWESDRIGNGSGLLAFIGTSNTDTLTWPQLYVTGCRSWDNGDSGYGGIFGFKATYDNCIALRIGNDSIDGDGKGFSIGLETPNNAPNPHFIIKNCLAVYCLTSGFRINSSRSRLYSARVLFYNNTAAYSYNNFVSGSPQYPTATDIIFRNNIGYGSAKQIGWNEPCNFSVQPELVYTSDHNSWDAAMGLTVTDNDFVSVDTTQLTAARNPDGSLPEMTYMRLKSTSFLIDIGTDVGLDYEGSAPDLGAYEFVESEPPDVPNVATGIITKLTPYTASVSYNVTFDGGGTVVSGVCWSTSTNPTTDDDKTVTNNQEGIFSTTITGLIKGTTYYVRAYATNASGTSYGENVEYSTPAIIRVKDGTTFQKWNGQFIDW